MAKTSERPIFQLSEIRFSEKNDAPIAEDGCEICQHCFNRPKLNGRVSKSNKQTTQQK